MDMRIYKSRRNILIIRIRIPFYIYDLSFRYRYSARIKFPVFYIKGKFDYNSIQSLSTEARQKLTRIDPDTIAQASRIPGISPSDINILLVMLGR